uniref:Ig-like domain-containing protein n=1 Tax=Trichuris muris TaxID=70415 RepID=A0A5S6R1T3_TRIMR
MFAHLAPCRHALSLLLLLGAEVIIVVAAGKMTPVLEALLLDDYGTPVYFPQDKSTVQLRCSSHPDLLLTGLLQLVNRSGAVLAQTEFPKRRFVQLKLPVGDHLPNSAYQCRFVARNGSIRSSVGSFGSEPRFCPDGAERHDPGLHCDYIRNHWCAHLRSIQPLRHRWTACMSAEMNSNGGPFVQVETAAPTTCHAFAAGRDVHFEVAEGYRCSLANFLDIQVLDQSIAYPLHRKRLVVGLVQPVGQNEQGRLLVLVKWSSPAGEGVVDCDMLKSGGQVVDSFRLEGASPQLANFSHDGAGSKLMKIACYLFPSKEAAAKRTVAVARTQGLVLLWDVRTEIWPPSQRCQSLYLLRCRFVRAPSKAFRTRIFWMLEQRVISESNGTYVDMFANTPGKYTCIGTQQLRSFNPPAAFDDSAVSFVEIPAGCFRHPKSEELLIAKSSYELRPKSHLAASRLFSMLFADRPDDWRWEVGDGPPLFDKEKLLDTLKLARKNHLLSIRSSRSSEL